MKNFLFFLAILISSYASGQYNPSLHTVTNKAIGIAQATPTDARSYFYDASLFVYRPYQSVGEVLTYLNIAKYRVGQFPIFVSSGALQSGGTFTGGSISEYWFKDGTANSNLVLKTSTGATDFVENVSMTSSQSVDTFRYQKGGSNFFIGAVDRGSGITGGAVTWASGLTFNIASSTFYLKGRKYSNIAGQVTAAAPDPTYDRIDAIALDTSGQPVIIPGTASPAPASPIGNPLKQLIISYISVPHTDLVPPNVTSVLIYDENREWTGTTGSLTANFTNTSTVFHGKISTSYGTTTSTSYIDFTNGTTVDITSFGSFLFYLKLNQAITNGTTYSVSFYNGTRRVSDSVTIASAYGFNPANASTFQAINVPMTALNLTETVITKVRISITGVTNGGFIDYVQLQNSVSGGPGSPTATTLTGDVTGVGISTVPATLATVNTNPGTFGSITKIPVTTVNEKGLVTSITEVTIPTATNISSASFSGTTTKTLTLTKSDGTTVTANFTDLQGSGGTTTDTTNLHNQDSLLKAAVITAISVTGTTTKTITLTRQDGTTLTATYTDLQGSTDPLSVHISDTASMLAPYQQKISVTTNGTSGAATIIGNVINIPNYTTSSSGSTAVQTVTTTAGQTVVSFTSVPTTPSDYWIDAEGAVVPQSLYSSSGNNITFTGAWDAGQKVTLHKIK